HRHDRWHSLALTKGVRTERTVEMTNSAPRAALYARKSTKNDVADDAKSVALQITQARAFAEDKLGAVVVSEYVDDGISGAEFVNRPGLNALLEAAAQTPRAFDVLVVAAQDRIGRDMYRVAGVMHDLKEAGIAVWFYDTNERAQWDEPEDELMGYVRGF